jgi:outer membrane protein
MLNHFTSPRLLAGVALAALMSASTFAAPAGTWGVRVRGTYLDTANKSDAFTALAINFAADAVEVQSKWIPEFDISYWFTPNFSTEVVLTVPQKHEVTLKGVGSLGTFKHLPPHFMAVYHFSPDSAFQPYIGAGVNVTLISSVKLRVANVPLDLEDSSIGLSAQAGFDYDFGNGKFLNVDVKKTSLASDVTAGGARLTTAKLDPWLFSIGFGMRF